MSLRILLAHTGATFIADPQSFTSLDGLRSWIARKAGIESAHQILMTARGKQVKLQTISADQEIFLYDRRILASSSSLQASNLVRAEDRPVSFAIQKPPEVDRNDLSLQEFQSLFKRQRAWAIDLSDGSKKVVGSIRLFDREAVVVRRGVAIAVENIKQHVNNLKPKYEESRTWADQISEDQMFLLKTWKGTFDALVSLQAYAELGSCLQGVSAGLRKKIPSSTQLTTVTLQDFVEMNEVNGAAEVCKAASHRFADRVANLGSTFDSVVLESRSIIENFQQTITLSDSDAGDQAGRLMEEIRVLVGKICDDYEYVLGQPNNAKSTSQASKTAQLHKVNIVPTLIQMFEEIKQLLKETVERKGQMIESSVRFLQQISVVESTVSSVHSKLAMLDVNLGNEEAFDMLNFVIRIPSVYGTLLVECVRRQEWAVKMTADSSSLVEEVATYKEEEAKRRKRWVKDMAGAVDLASLDDMALGIEVNVHAQKQRWPRVSRDNIIDYIQGLRQVGIMNEAAKEIEELFKALDAPSRQQSRRARAFKNGSVHEAAYGKTSLLLRGDDELILTMRNEKSRVEDKLKSSESRVRKLEDLLHRQSQLNTSSRPTSAAGYPINNAPVFERYATSPVPTFTSALSKARETGSRRSSVSSRRFSMTDNAEDKSLAQRIVSLEADLVAQKAQTAQLEKTATAKTNSEDLLKDQIQEAISTQKDLLGNFKAQQQEFDSERRSLEGENKSLADENSKLRLRLDELEDEFDRAMESREQVDKVHVMEEELERLRRDTNSEVQRLNGQIGASREDYKLQCEKADRLECELQRKEEERVELSAQAHDLNLRLQNQDQAQTDHHRALRSTLIHMSQDVKAPDDFGALVETIEATAERSTAYLQSVKDALGTVRANNQALEQRVQSQGDELYDLRERLGNEEREVFSTREELNAQQSRNSALQSQIDFERSEHEELKKKFATGSIDAEALRSRLTQAERTLSATMGKLTLNEEQHQNSEGQLKATEAELEALRKGHNDSRILGLAQASRAVEVSQRLHVQISTLERLLEQVGLAVTKQNGAMTIQKVSRAASASAVINDPSASMKKSLSSSIPFRAGADSTIDPKILEWPTLEDPTEIEHRFGEFIGTVASFDTDVFSEAIFKRVKEVEHIARKWQKEARAYRDKSHRFQGEAHDRVALRNFKEGDLALFLPTRDQATKPWAAFNVGAPHCFLREQDSHNLSKRDWLIARISKVEERVVDLSKSINGGLKGSGDQRCAGDKSDEGTFPNDENPYELSDGLRWYLIDAAEEKPGAPINVGVSKVTVASANVDAKGSIRMKKPPDGNGATKTLSRSLDSRRSSTNSKKGLVGPGVGNPTAGPGGLEGMLEQSIDNAAVAAASASNLHPQNEAENPQDTGQTRNGRMLDVPTPSGQTTDHTRSVATSPSKSLRGTKSSSSPQKASPEKPRSRAWDALWSLDLNLESGKGRK